MGKVMFRRKQRKIQPYFSSKEKSEHKKVINLLLKKLLLIKLLLIKLLLAKKRIPCRIYTNLTLVFDKKKNNHYLCS